MGLNIYYLDESGEDVEIESHLRITHNLNTIVSELGLLVDLPYYEVIWIPDEMFGLKNGEVPVGLVLKVLPDLIKNLLKFEDHLTEYLPSNGYGTFEDLIRFLCDYLKECYKHKNAYIFCCRWFEKSAQNEWSKDQKVKYERIKHRSNWYVRWTIL